MINSKAPQGPLLLQRGLVKGKRRRWVILHAVTTSEVRRKIVRLHASLEILRLRTNFRVKKGGKFQGAEFGGIRKKIRECGRKFPGTVPKTSREGRFEKTYPQGRSTGKFEMLSRISQWVPGSGLRNLVGELRLRFCG